MKYSIEIDQPLQKVVELFINKDNLNKWQKKLVGYELISGTPNTVGAVTKLNYKGVTIFETITASSLPAEIAGQYEHKHNDKTVMSHSTSHQFSSSGQNKTRYEMDIRNEIFFGFLPKLMSGLMAGAIKKYNQGLLNDFKSFAEQTR
jgi:hypothetical protein